MEFVRKYNTQKPSSNCESEFECRRRVAMLFRISEAFFQFYILDGRICGNMSYHPVGANMNGFSGVPPGRSLPSVVQTHCRQRHGFIAVARSLSPTTQVTQDPRPFLEAEPIQRGRASFPVLMKQIDNRSRSESKGCS